jgi:protoheme IX farnesyltransferase
MKTAGLRVYAALGRLRISFLAALTTMTGYLLAAFSVRPGMFIVGAGVFLLASGASALNQYQEQGTDALMERTKMRPLPMSAVTGRAALFFSGGSAMSGLLLIFLAGGYSAVLIGLFAVAWYNGLYTSLKKRTAFASVPGALVGAAPPALGWSTGGGSLTDPGLLLLSLFFFLWQVPHFWLYAVNLKKQYAQAGFPLVTSVFSERQLSRIVFVWIASLSVCTLLFIPYGLTLHVPARFFLVAASLWLVLQGGRILLRSGDVTIYTIVLDRINLYLMAVMVLLFADRIAGQL